MAGRERDAFGHPAPLPIESLVPLARGIAFAAHASIEAIMLLAGCSRADAQELQEDAQSDLTRILREAAQARR